MGHQTTWKAGMLVSQQLPDGTLRAVRLVSYDREADCWVGTVRSGELIGNITTVRQPPEEST